MAFDLRPHQSKALDLLKESLRSGKRRPILQAPCGFGKTIIAARIVAGALEKGNRVAFFVPMISLIDQTFKKFVDHGINPADVGVMQADHEWRRPHAPVQICSVQTVARRGMPEASLLVIDECHIRDAKLHAYLNEHRSTVTAIGLSATPFAKGLGRVFDDLICPVTMRELIDGGYLSKFRVFAPTHPDLSAVKIDAKSGDYQTGELSGCMSKPHLVADIVATWLEKGENRPTLCFAVDRAHAAVLHEQFEANGVSSAYVDANTPREERLELAKRFSRGEIKVICNIGTMTTGVDLDVRCIIFARPTKSESLFVQCIGRGLRTAEGKDYCIAEGSPVLTDKGLVKIENVTLDHKVWDGENWVSHSGAVCKGIQRVIGYGGIIATPDHEVWTENGWKQLWEAAYGRLRIAQTERNGKAIRLSENRLARGSLESYARWIKNTSRSYGMRHVWQAHLDKLLEHCEGALGWVPGLQSAFAGTEVAAAEAGASQGPMHQPQQRSVRGLWRTWDRIPVPDCDRSRNMGEREFGDRQVSPDRPDKQRQSLRGWKFAAIDKQGKYGEQAETKVWDIVNAGPMNRFTVSGRLVHNCTILDHSDTHLRLGMVTDISIDELDTGKPGAGDAKKKEKLDPLPKECSHCQCLVPAMVDECPNCGHVFKRFSSVVQEDGELIELGSKKRKGKSATSVDRLMALPRAELFGQIRQVQKDRGWSEGRTAHVYRDITGCWPNQVRLASRKEPSPELLSFIRHKDLAYAKGRAKAKAMTMEARHG